MVLLSPVRRRIVYVIVFEILAIVLATLLLSALSGGQGHSSFPVAVACSVTAVIWNFVFNTAFEAWERLRGNLRRTLLHRTAHTIGFEGGLVIILIPLFMWWYQATVLEALGMEVPLLLFFLIYTFSFTWAFDLLVPIAGRAATSGQ